MKLVATVLFGSSLEATPAPVLGAVQCVLLGVDEFLINHPLCEILSTVVQPPTGPTVTLKTPFVDYKQAGVSVVQIKITPSAVIAQRGGQICAALVALTREESDAYVMGSEYQRADLVSEYTATPLESPSFVDIQQYPGSITKPASSSISITRRTKGFQAMKHRIGADNYINGVLGGTKGGPFLYKLYYGYSDMAASSGDAKQLYRAEEGMFNVSCSARVTLFECGRTFLRAFPVVTCLTNSVAICDGQGLGRVEHELPLSFFSGVGQNMVLRKTRSEVESYLRGDPIVEEIEDGVRDFEMVN
jgi:hypothetical protein